jgi:hypothetical protein
MSFCRKDIDSDLGNYLEVEEGEPLPSTQGTTMPGRNKFVQMHLEVGEFPSPPKGCVGAHGHSQLKRSHTEREQQHTYCDFQQTVSRGKELCLGMQDRQNSPCSA